MSVTIHSIMNTWSRYQVWIEQNTASPFTDIDIGVGTAQMGNIEQTVANEDTLPDNIAWTFARGEENAEFLGNIDPGKGKSIWIRRHAGPTKSGSSYPSDNYILRFKFLRTGALDPKPPSGDDPFGIRMIYKTQETGNVSAPFYMNMNDPLGDCRFMSQNPITKQGDGSWSMGPGARIRAFTSGGGCRRDEIWTKVLDTYDHDTWGDREWMSEANDWKNIEITCYFKALAFSSDATRSHNRKLYLYSRGHRHNTGVGGGCSGTSYKGVTYQEQGELKWHKEAFHDGSQPCGDRNIESFKEGVAIPGLNSWWGMKVMMWNYPNPANPNIGYVHLELWLDLSGTNTWVKMGERNDVGGWYPGMPSTTCPGDEHCGGHQDQIIKWGGPISEMRMDDGYDSVAFKWYSCREIIPQAVIEPPPPGPVPPPEPPPPPPPATGVLDPFGILKLNETKSAGKTWYSTAWASNGSRLLNEGNTDPFDSKLKYLNGSPSSTQIEITGAAPGELIQDEYNSSCRIFVNDSWLNTEQTIYQFVDTTDNSWVDIGARSRSRHETSCSWGNYSTRWRDTRGDTGGQPPVEPSETWVAIETEVMHPHYRRHIDEKAWPAGTTGMIKGQWIGFKNVTRTITASGHVKVEGYVNYDITKQTASDWIKTNEFIHTGDNLSPDIGWATGQDFIDCQGQGDNIANKVIAEDPSMFRYTSTGNCCWWRINGGNNMKFKYASVREINGL